MAHKTEHSIVGLLWMGAVFIISFFVFIYLGIDGYLAFIGSCVLSSIGGLLYNVIARAMNWKRIHIFDLVFGGVGILP